MLAYARPRCLENAQVTGVNSSPTGARGCGFPQQKGAAVVGMPNKEWYGRCDHLPHSSEGGGRRIGQAGRLQRRLARHHGEAPMVVDRDFTASNRLLVSQK